MHPKRHIETCAKLNKGVKPKEKYSSSHLDENNTLFSFDTNHSNSSGSAEIVLAEYCAHHGEGQQAGMRLGKEEGAVEPWGEGFGRGSGMCLAEKAAVAAGSGSFHNESV